MLITNEVKNYSVLKEVYGHLSLAKAKPLPIEKAS
jgi:hypothetical protein